MFTSAYVYIFVVVCCVVQGYLYLKHDNCIGYKRATRGDFLMFVVASVVPLLNIVVFLSITYAYLWCDVVKPWLEEDL